VLIQGLKNIKNHMGSGKLNYFKLKQNESALVRFLVTDAEDPNLIAVYEHDLSFRDNPPFTATCIGQNCPLCAKGIAKRLAIYFPLYDKRDNQYKIWRRGVKFAEQIEGYLNKYGELNKRDYQIERKGTNIQNTTYNLYPEDPKPFEPDIEAFEELMINLKKSLAPRTKEELIGLVEGNDLLDGAIEVEIPDEDVPF